MDGWDGEGFDGEKLTNAGHGGGAADIYGKSHSWAGGQWLVSRNS